MAADAFPAQGLTTENVVVSRAVGQARPFQRIAMDLPGSGYDPETVPGVRYWREKYRAPTLILRSGKLVCTGAATIDDAERAVRDAKDALAALGVDIEANPIHAQTLVASGDLDASVNLNAAAIGLGLEMVEYEPEFPGTVIVTGSERKPTASAVGVSTPRPVVAIVGFRPDCSLRTKPPEMSVCESGNLEVDGCLREQNASLSALAISGRPMARPVAARTTTTAEALTTRCGLP